MPSDAADAGNKILLRCPHCGALFMANREIVGKRGPCRKCKQPFDVIEDVILDAPGAEGGHPGTGEGPSPSGCPGATFATQVAKLARGDLVHTDFDGRTYWEAARISEKTGDRLLLTTLSGRQFYATADHVRELEVIPGSLVVTLDEARGSYVPGVAHAIVKDAVCVSSLADRLHWRPREVVFPDAVDVEARVVRKDSGKKLVEVGRICRKSRVGYRIRYDDGLELPWVGSARGESVGIIPAAISLAAPRKSRSAWSDRRCVRAALVLVGTPVVLFLILMLAAESWQIRVPGAAVLFALYSVLARLVTRSVSPLFGEKAHRVVTVAVVLSVLAFALAFHRGFYGTPAVILYGGLAIGACLLGKRKMPRRIQPAYGEKKDQLDALLDRSSDYRKGERVLCLLPGEPFLHVAEVKACTKKQVEVTVPGGETHVLKQRDVFPYEVAVQQRVLASRAKLKIYLPAVITHIKDETFTVRFDDGEAASCSLRDVWFLCRKEVLRVGRAKCQAMLETVDVAMAEARHACEEGNPARAHEALSRALGRHPFDPTLHLGQAMVFEREGKFTEAAAEAYEAIRDVSSDPVPYTILGSAYLKMEQYVEAEEAFRAALNLAPDEAVHWQNVGRALLKQGEEALAGSFFSGAKLRADLAA